jgi:hypothetical protein
LILALHPRFTPIFVTATAPRITVCRMSRAGSRAFDDGRARTFTTRSNRGGPRRGYDADPPTCWLASASDSP